MKRYLAPLCAALMLSSATQAQDSWTGASDNLWTNLNNWFVLAVPLPGANVQFDANATANLSTALGADFALNSLTVLSPTGDVAIGGNVLTLGAGGLNMGAATRNLTISSRVVASTAQTWNVNAARQVQVSGRLEGNGSLTLTGAGTSAFSADGSANVYSGNVTVASGTLLWNGAANQPPFGTRPARTVTVLSNATLTANNGTHNPFGTAVGGILSLVISNGTFNVPAYCHMSNLTMWAGTVAPNGAMVDGLDLQAGALLSTKASDNPAQITARTGIRGLTRVDVEDGAAAVDLSWSTQIGGNNQSLIKTNAGTMELSGTLDNSSLGLRQEQGKTVLAKASSASVHALGQELVVNGGEVELGGTGGDQLYISITPIVNGGVLDLNGTSEGINGLAGTGGIIRNDAAGLGTLTLGQNNGGATYAGAIVDGVGPVALVKVGTGTQVLTGTNVISGGTTLSNGVLQVDGELNGSVVGVRAGAVLSGSGSVGSTVVLDAGARVTGGGVGTAGTLTIVSNLTGVAGATNLFDLSSSSTIGGGVNDLLTVGGNLDPQTAGIRPVFTAIPSLGGYRLINYSGTLLSGYTLLATNAGRYGLALDTATASQVNLLVSGTNKNLRWNGTSSTAWDLNTTANWFDRDALAPGLTFYDLDTVLFDDTPGVTTTVTVTGTLMPQAFIVAADTNVFTFTGAGKISGAMGLTKVGTNRMVFGNSGGNDYTGITSVSNGLLALGNYAALPVSGKTTVKAGATFDFAGQGASTARAYTFEIEGSGTAGQGAIDNSGGSIAGNASVSNLTLTGDAAIGTGSRWDIGTGASGMRLLGNGFGITKVGVGEITVRPEFVSNVARMVISAGRLKHEGFSQATPATLSTTNIVLPAGTLANYGTLTLNYPVEFRGGVLNNDSGTATWTGPMALLSNTTMNLGNPVVLGGVVSGAGLLTKTGGSSLTFSNANTFTGGLIVNNGGGQISAASPVGSAIPSPLTLGSGVDGGGNAVLRTFNNDQFSPGVAVTNRGSWNDWTYFILMGTTQTVAGLADETGAGVLEATETESGISSDALLIFSGPGDYSCNSYTRDSAGGTSTSKLRMLKLGAGTQTLAGSNRGQPTDFSGGIIVSNGWINLKSSRAAGNGLIELAGGGLALDGVGLAEGRFGGWNTGTANNEECVKIRAQYASNPSTEAGGVTWAYTGYINVTNPAPVIWTFAEQYDDNAYLMLDGEVLLNNTGWNTPTIATRTLSPGIHSIDIRVYDGGGGIGPNNGWTNGVGYDVEGRNTATATNFAPFADAGDGAFLQTLVRVTNAIRLRADAQLKVSSAWGPTNLITGTIAESGGSRSITKVGAGALLLTAPTQTFTGPLTVEAGKLLVSGGLAAGSVTVKTGAAFGGSPYAGAVSVQHLGRLEAVDAATGENDLVATALTLGENADSTTRVSVVLGGKTNILQVTGAGGLTANGKVIIDVGAIAPVYGGVFDLIRYSGTLGGSLANFELGTVGFTALRGPMYLQDSGSAIQLVVPAATALFWDGTPLNWWDVIGFSNWVGYPGGPGLQFQDGDPVIFNDHAQNCIVEVSVPVSPSSLIVAAESSNYVFTGASSITGTVGITKTGAGTLTILNTNANTGPLVISNGVVSVDQLANGGVPGQIGAQSSAATNLVLNGGTLRYTGPSATVNRMFTVGGNGGVIDIATAGQTLTFNGAGWNLGGTLRKRGPGYLRFTSYGYSYAGAATDLIVEEGTVGYDSSYWFNTGAGPYPYDASQSMRVIVTNGATLYTVTGALGFQPWPGDGSLDDVTVERNSTWQLGGANGVNALLLRGGRVLGGRIIPLYDLGVNVRASDTNSYCSAEWGPYDGNRTWSVDVENGTAEPDFILDGAIYNIATLNRTGVGRMVFRNMTFTPSTLNISAGIMQVGDATAPGTLGGAGTVNNAATLVYGQSTTANEAKTIAGAGTFVQAGSGVTILTAANSYTGPTIISNGTLRVNGSLASGSAVTVTPAGTLGGYGVVNGSVALAGAVAPGASVGTLTTGSETWQGGAAYRFEASDVTGTFGTHPGWDKLQISGDLAITATPGSKFLVDVRSVNATGLSAPLFGLAGNSTYTMAIARVSGVLTGFDSGAFTASVQNVTALYTITNAYVQLTGSDIEVVLQTGGQAAPLIWDPNAIDGGAQDGDGTWDLSNTNWWAGTQDVQWPAIAAIAQIGADTNSGGSYTINLGAPVVQAYSLLFPTGSTYTLSGTGRLDVTGGDLTLSNGLVTLSAQLGGIGFTKRGPGTLTLNRAAAPANSYAGAITVAEGRLVASGYGGDGVVRGDINVRSGATFELQSSHIIANNAALTVDAGGTADLGTQSDVIGNLRGGGTVSGTGGQVDFDYLSGGQDYVFWGSITGSKGLFLNNDQVRGGTQWLNGTNSLSYIAMEGPDVLRFSSNGVTVLSGTLGINTGGGYDGAVVIVDEGHDLTVWRLETQNASDHNAQFYQNGGRVTVTDTSFEEGPMRIGHYPGNENSTYWLNGGSLYITNAGTYGKMTLGVDGYGFFNQAGGTAMVKRLSLNERGGGGGGFFALSNGVFSVGADGIVTEGGVYNVTFAGGTLGAWASYTISVTSTLTGANGDLRVDPASYAIVWNGGIDGVGGLNVDGAGGTVLLSGPKTYAGRTTVTRGQLLVNGSISTNSVYVGPLGTLAGTGSIGGTVTSDGSVVPGWGNISRLSMGNSYTQSVSASLSLEIGAGSNDLLAVTGDVKLGGQLLVAAVGYAPAFGDAWTVLTATAVSGTFATTNMPSLPASNAWIVTYSADKVVVSVGVGGPAPTPYDLWAQSITNPALRGEQEDADGDGYPNLWEYSQGTDPTNALDGLKVTMIRTNGVYALKFNRATGAVDLVYAVEASYGFTNSADWTVIASNQFGGAWFYDATVTETNTGPVRQVTAEDNDPLAPRRGLRLKVTRP